MDIARHLELFENSLTSYTGDDPLEPWDRFVQYLEKKIPAEDSSGMSLVFDRLVQRFLHEEKYANDTRYVNHCIRCGTFYAEPIALYSYIHGKGVGTRTAALYVAWAQQFEQRGMNDQADVVYQRAVENQAQPADTVLHEYRQFQLRTSRSQAAVSGSQAPLQSSQLVNQMSSRREPQAQSKGSVDCLSQLPEDKTIRIISRSENSGLVHSSQSSAAAIQTISVYRKEDLECEGSELSFEEVRAARYFFKLKQEKERREDEAQQKMVRKQKEDILSMRGMLDELNQGLEACGGFTSQPVTQQVSEAEPAASVNPPLTQHSFGQPRPSNRLSSRLSLGLRLHSEPTFIHETSTAPEPPQQESLTRAASINTQSSEVSHHASLLADRSVCSSGSAQVSTQVFSARASLVHPRPVEQPAAFEPSSFSAPQRPACFSGVNDVSLCQDDHVQQHGTTDQALPVSAAPAQPEEKLDVSQGSTANLSHITPNNSLGFVHATPSRVLPSPTVNTREALDVIMDMFQAPTLLENTFSNTSMHHTTERDFAAYPGNGAASSFSKPPSTTPFTIFQDDNEDNNKENCSAAAPVVQKAKPTKALAVIPVSKADNETPELMPDESTMWGARYNSLNSLAACPNSTTDFAMLAQMVSTPFTHKAPFFSDSYQSQENNCAETFDDAEDNPYIVRQPKKLSPIMEQSPSDEKLSETTLGHLRAKGAAEQGTIVGDGLATTQHSMAASSVTVVQPPPPAVLSFRDQTLVHADASVHISRSPTKSTGPGWDVYMSPEQPPKPASPPPLKPESSAKRKSHIFTIKKDFDKPPSPEQAARPAFGIPESPESAPALDWLAIRSPQAVAEPDLDAFMSPRRAERMEASPQKSLDVPMSPEQPKLCADVPMSPMQQSQLDTWDEPMNLERGTKMSIDVPMSPAAPSSAHQLVCDPWDTELISGLLSSMNPPLTSHPYCITWKCPIPSIAPKTTITMGKASLRVDCILGEGAFATVYRATDPTTSEKIVLKVQKPANPWEFYINTQLDARLPPNVRHLYSNIHSAHLFHNGSILLNELHSCGTLLNAVNMYKKLNEMMPQPLVIYFTVCILHMVEQLHSIHIIHADIKPDNFMLGERFLENKSFDPDNLDHGLALIDLGQSIDMDVFTQGTAFTARCLTSGFQCTEMLSGRPWSYQTDYFGIAGTVHCMLFGTYMQVTQEDGVWKTNTVFRRNPHADMWLEFFHTLLNVPDCKSLPSLSALRRRLTAVLQQNYSSKLPTLKNRLVVLLLENLRSARR
ncbi:mitotic checkpoint serine/threonine-protein kinase BUB1 isoform X2 [Myripristis murdjan]|uniref:mitotic checkpoint serine/threonine-protein kinase BUB1 isoform X2 n=1 Tax=Myripristis murdjan TaxID=586833 RepID=UPI0011761154|nr:mitotic checkpoint serine/threonine-protein kinase BUB1 isoform X2 [Myripristis murdjan]